jgi:hypothetical protein
MFPHIQNSIAFFEAPLHFQFVLLISVASNKLPMSMEH